MVASTTEFAACNIAKPRAPTRSLQVGPTNAGQMDVSTSVEFLRAQGFRVIETPSCYWQDRAMRDDIGPQWIHFFVNGPPHRPIRPSWGELMEVFSKGRAMGVKFTTTADSKGKDSYILVCSDSAYDLGSLDSKARNKVRQGLKRCTVERIDFDYLAANGMQVMRDSWKRQGRDPTVSDRWWQLFCDSAKRFEDVEAWGAFVAGNFAAFMATTLIEDVCYIGFRWSVSRFLHARTNNALEFVVTKEMLRRPSVSMVYHGAEPLQGLDSLIRYKKGMGFRALAVKQCVIFNPLVRPLFNRPALALGRKLIKKCSRTEFWKRVDGILRFYQESQGWSRSQQL